jgi:hypothetical protein
MHAFSPKNALFCTFLQGGGTTFWQAENGGFSGVRRRARARARDTFCVTFSASGKRPHHRTVFDLKNRTVALTQHSPSVINKIIY